MQNNKKHKLKPMLLMIICITILFSLFTPLNVHAASGAMTDASLAGTSNPAGGPTYARNGWIFYMIDVESNTQTTQTIGIAGNNYWALTDRNGNTIPNVNVESRYGVDIASWEPKPAPWGFGPFGDGGVGNGSRLKTWLLKENGHNAIGLITKFFGTEHVAKWQSKEEYLVFEVVAANSLYMNRKATGIWWVATTYHWGQIQQEAGLPEYGDPQIQRYTNGVYTFCVQLEDTPEIRALGYEAPPAGVDYRTNSYMANRWAGNGIGMIWSDSGQTTCDEPLQPTEHAAAIESVGSWSIVKNYRTHNLTTGVYTDNGCYVENDLASNILIENETEYQVIGWTSSALTQSIGSAPWNPPARTGQQGTSAGSVNLASSDKALYVLLEKVEGEEEDADANYILTQSTITRYVHLSAPDNRLAMPEIQNYKFIWSHSAHKTECSGHTYYTACTGHGHSSSCKSDCSSNHNCGTNCVSNTDYCSNWIWIDKAENFSLQNAYKNNYPDVLATKGGWENITAVGGATKKKYTYERKMTGDFKLEIIKWDYACVLHRGKDKLTVAEWKNIDLGTSANSDLVDVSGTSYKVANTDSGTRKILDFFDKFNAYIIDGSDDKRTVFGPMTAAEHSGEKCPPDVKTSNMTTPLTIAVTVKLQTYSGKSDGGSNDTSCDTSERRNHPHSGYNITTGREVPSGGTISFRPYIQMKYNVYGSTAWKKAYVLGEYQRQITPNDYAELSWNKKGDANLTLSSTQWSTHASAINKWGSGNVLPGGATLSLAIKSTDRQKMLITTYQTIVEGSGLTQVEYTGSANGLTRANAIAEHNGYVNSILAGFEYLNVEQWVSTDANTSGNVWSASGAAAIHPGDNLSAAGHSSQTASEEDKYYFRNDGELLNGNAGEGDLDVKINGTTTHTYTFFTNTFGDIRYTVDNTSPNIGSETMGNSASDATANMINARTHVVDKLRAAVEQHTGADGTALTGGAWYNEAFDGITVIVQETEITVGYIDPSAERTSVLDPKLTQTSLGQSDMFNPAKYNISQYRTKPRSAAYDRDEQIGYFKGYDMFMEDMAMTFWSKRFYIPNVTTQDLH